MDSANTFAFKEPEHIPLYFSISDEFLDQYFENGITPEPGDTIETVCYSAEVDVHEDNRSALALKFRYRVRRSLKRRLKEFFRIK